MGNTTHVRVSEDTADELYELKSRGDSYDDIIRQLIVEHHQQETMKNAEA